MDPKRDYSRAVPVKIPTVVVTFDMTAPDPREKELRLTFYLRPDATRDGIAADLQAITARLNEAEIGLGGKGLVEDGPPREYGGEHPRVEIRFRAADPTDAGIRFQKLAGLLGHLAGNYPPKGLTAADSFLEYIPTLNLVN